MLHLAATFMVAFSAASIFLLGTVGVSYRVKLLKDDRALVRAFLANVAIAATFATVVTLYVGTM